MKVYPTRALVDAEIDATDLFCGGGGSAIGLTAAGVKVKIAANHWRLAVETHQTNFPDTDHDVADISQVDPRRYPTTTILWASPECTNLSQSKGVSRTEWQDTALPEEASSRSRATMWDVPRFVEAMWLRGSPYKAIIVENVAEAMKWGPGGTGALFQAWLQAMTSMGYDYKLVFLNSMFAGGGRYRGIIPAPQSRDRMYMVFWLKGLVAPNLDIRPSAFCERCDTEIEAVQTWKRPDKQWGKYNQQYTYNCPVCTQRVAPYTRAAAEAIDWQLAGQRIGDRETPLAAATMRRIAAGLERYAGHPGLVVPVERGHDPNKKAWSAFEVLPTQTARATQGIAFTPFIASIRGGGSANKTDPVTEPMMTVSAGGNHHLLVTPPGFMMRNNGSHGGAGGEMCTPFWEPMRTLTTKGHQSVVIAPHLLVPYNRTGQARSVAEPMHTLRTHDGESLVSVQTAIDDCEFRMLQPHEQGAGMAFPAEYVVLGTKRERTRQYGNAVTPPASELIGTAVVEALVASGEATAPMLSERAFVQHDGEKEAI